MAIVTEKLGNWTHIFYLQTSALRRGGSKPAPFPSYPEKQNGLSSIAICFGSKKKFSSILIQALTWASGASVKGLPLAWTRRLGACPASKRRAELVHWITSLGACAINVLANFSEHSEHASKLKSQTVRHLKPLLQCKFKFWPEKYNTCILTTS